MSDILARFDIYVGMLFSLAIAMVTLVFPRIMLPALAVAWCLASIWVLAVLVLPHPTVQAMLR